MHHLLFDPGSQAMAYPLQNAFSMAWRCYSKPMTLTIELSNFSVLCCFLFSRAKRAQPLTKPRQAIPTQRFLSSTISQWALNAETNSLQFGTALNRSQHGAIHWPQYFSLTPTSIPCRPGALTFRISRPPERRLFCAIQAQNKHRGSKSPPAFC